MYRYWLSRVWDPAEPAAVFIMLNPSTADAEVDDPTIRKCIGFAERWGCGGIVVVNLFAYRTTYPKVLWREASRGIDIIGPDNDTHLRRVFQEVDVSHIVAAWGGGVDTCPRDMAAAVEMRISNVIELLRGHDCVQCLGETSKGQPRHPLMLAYATPLEAF